MKVARKNADWSSVSHYKGSSHAALQKDQSRSLYQMITIIVLMVIAALLLATNVKAQEQLITLQGKITDSNGALVNGANVSATIWDSATGGTLIYNSSADFAYNVTNGFFDIVLGSVGTLNLNASQTYYMDVQINDEDIDWDGQERRQFQSPVGYEFSGAENFTVDTNVLFVDSTNNRVGIGTSNPITKLVVEAAQPGPGAGYAQVFINTSADADGTGIALRNTEDSGERVWSIMSGTGGGSPNQNLRIFDTTAGADRINIDSLGNVGIGTTSPAERLVVIGNVNISGTLNVSGRIAFPNLASCDTIDTDANGVLTCGTDDGGAGGNNNSLWNQTLTAIYQKDLGKNVGIGTRNPGRSLEVAGSINGTQLNISSTVNLAYASGNVGIGTSTASEKLVVIGNANISGTLNVSGRVSFPNLANCDTIDTDANGVLTCGTDSTSAGGSDVSGIGTAGYIALWNETDALNTSEIFQSGAGHIGINHSAPTEKLSVGGNFSTTETNNTLGQFTVFRPNSTCAGFRFGNSGGIILSCE